MISCRLPGEHDVLHIRADDCDAIARRDLGDVAADVAGELVAVGENVFERHGRQRTARRELHVAVEPVLIGGDLLDRGLCIGDAELHDNRDADRDLIGGENLLALDREFAFAHVDEHGLDHRRWGQAREGVAARQLVAPGLQHAQQHAVLIPKRAMRILDDEIIGHGSRVAGRN
jgi:hypothetical protein